MIICAVKYHWFVRGNVPNFLVGSTYYASLADLHINATIACTVMVTNYPSSYSGLRTGPFFVLWSFQYY